MLTNSHLEEDALRSLDILDVFGPGSVSRYGTYHTGSSCATAEEGRNVDPCISQFHCAVY